MSKEERFNRVLLAQESIVFSGYNDYEKVKNDLILRPLNYHFVKSELKDVPHIRIGDVALVLYAVIAHASGNYFTAKMPRSQIEKWKRSEEEVLGTAMNNTCFLYPPRLYSVEDMLLGNGKPHKDGIFMVEGYPLKIKKSLRGYILTNTLEINGAIAMFYPGVARKIAECFGEDFYIAFTSINEAIVHSASMISPDVIRGSLKDTNRHCNRNEEVLTNKVYCYSLEKKRFGVIDDDKFVEVYQNLRW